MKLRYERGALADLDEIFSYVAKDDPQAAGRLVARIEAAAARIAATPYLGQVTRNPRFRRFPVGNYLIVYEVGSDGSSFTTSVMVPGEGHGKDRSSTCPGKVGPVAFALPVFGPQGEGAERAWADRGGRQQSS
jgi:toxin ParE1/3/4